MTRKQFDRMVDEAIERAKQNLQDEEQAKCIEALNNWRKNYANMMGVKKEKK